MSGSFLGLADGDGDGDVDLLVWERDEESSYLTLWINDGYDFVSSDRFSFDSRKDVPLSARRPTLGPSR